MNLDRLLTVSLATIIDTRPAEGFPNLEPPNEPPFVEHLRFAPYPQAWPPSTPCTQRLTIEKAKMGFDYDCSG